MQLLEGFLIVIDGHDDRQTHHDRNSVGDGSPPGGSWLLHPAWIGLPGRWVVGSLMMCVVWWCVGIWLYRGHLPQYDEKSYIEWARYWRDFDFDYLARGWPGTMTRPYLYQLFIAVISAPFPAVLKQVGESRLYIALIQVTLYSGSVLRLAQHAQAVHGRTIGLAILVGLLALPFPVFTQVEVLTESIGLTLFSWFVIAAIQSLVIVRGARVLAKFASVTFLTMGLVLVRSAFVPVALIAITWLGLVVARMASGRTVREVFQLSGYVILLAIPVGLIALPQAYLMYEHLKYTESDPNLWGVGNSQITWSLTMAKYSTSGSQCQFAPAGIVYPMPFYSEAERARVFAQGDGSFVAAALWHALHPYVGLLHLFEALNHDFPTTYVTTFNPIVSIGFNALGLMVASIGIVTMVRRAWAVRKDVAKLSFVRADQTGASLVALVVATIWGMTAFTAVETRFGIIPWCGLAVAASYGAITWAADFMAGTQRWGLVSVALGVAGSGLWLSRWLLSTVEPVTRAIAAGC